MVLKTVGAALILIYDIIMSESTITRIALVTRDRLGHFSSVQVAKHSIGVLRREVKHVLSPSVLALLLMQKEGIRLLGKLYKLV